MTAPATERQPRPAATEPRPYHFPRFERRRLPNGIQLVIAPVKKLPVVTTMFVFDAGAASEPAGHEGVANLTARLLLEGTTELSGDELTDRFERLGASAEAYAGWDSAVLTVTSLAEHFGEALDLSADVLRTPGFRERDVARLRAERLADLLQQRTEPRGLADDSFARALYPEDSRYSKPEDGDEASVRTLGREAVVAFHEARFRRGDLAIIVAGDVNADDVAVGCERLFGNWSGPSASRVSLVDRPARTSRMVHVVPKSDAPQSELRIGQVGVARSHPDYFAIVVMNAILGGLFSSRINLNLREAHGYTYGAFSGFDWRRQAGPFVVGSAVQSNVTAEAAREVLLEIDRMRAEPVTDGELSLAQSYLDGVFPIRYETTSAIAGALASLIVYGLPDDYFDTYRPHIRALTRDDVLQAARTHLDPAQLQILVVGDPEAVVEPLRGLDFGPVELMPHPDVD